VTSELLATVRLGALNELDRRVISWLPSMVPAAAVQGLVTRRMTAELLKELGVSALTLDAIDFTRPSLLGVLAPAAGRRRSMTPPRLVALVPMRGDPRLVADSIRLSYPESTEEAWGGLQVRSAGRTIAWVHARGSWVAVAPTAPLLDSALRALAPLAQGVEEGTLRMEVRFAQALSIYRSAIVWGWSMIKSMAGRSQGVTQKPLATILFQLVPLLEPLGPYLASLDSLEVLARLGDDGFSVGLKVKPLAGGKAAEWIGSLKLPGRSGLELLPQEAAAVSVASRPEELRLVGVKVFGLVTDWVVGQVLSQDLPVQISERGLMDRKTPANLEQYRRALRDLNLADYKASHAIYRLLFALKAFRRHLAESAPRLLAASSGELAGAYYGAGGRLGMARVEGLVSAPAHRAAMIAFAMGMQRHGKDLLSAIWDALPAEARSKLGVRQNPLQLSYNPVALQVGRQTVSSLAMRIAWPAPPRAAGQQGADAAPDDTDQTWAMMRRLLGHAFGAGPITYAWTHVGNRVLSVMGHDWQGRMKAMLGRTAPGAKQPAAMEDPLFQNALRDLRGESVSLSLVSGARLLLAGLELLKAMEPRFFSPQGFMGSTLQGITQTATAAQHASMLRLSKDGGNLLVEGRLHRDDIKGALVSVGMLFAFGMHRSHGGGGGAHPMPHPVPPPHHSPQSP
jgi:hypothetical protein